MKVVNLPMIYNITRYEKNLDFLVLMGGSDDINMHQNGLKMSRRSQTDERKSPKRG